MSIFKCQRLNVNKGGEASGKDIEKSTTKNRKII